MVENISGFVNEIEKIDELINKILERLNQKTENNFVSKKSYNKLDKSKDFPLYLVGNKSLIRTLFHLKPKHILFTIKFDYEFKGRFGRKENLIFNIKISNLRPFSSDEISLIDLICKEFIPNNFQQYSKLTPKVNIEYNKTQIMDFTPSEESDEDKKNGDSKTDNSKEEKPKEDSENKESENKETTLSEENKS